MAPKDVGEECDQSMLKFVSFEESMIIEVNEPVLGIVRFPKNLIMGFRSACPAARRRVAENIFNWLLRSYFLLEKIEEEKDSGDQHTTRMIKKRS
jgi:hypothetical protein